ncbi:MAG: DsbA family protein [Spirochaetia bacterium]|jgi:predicted DsbA family dithiol-disulfide isomerase|nr:DsbA family protein [Spirochaetia bacterium]
MKKYIYTLIGLSIIGTVLSAAMWLLIYYPNALLGSEIYNPYIAIASSAWSRILSVINIPLPVLSMFMYTYIIFILLVADYAKNRYPVFSASLIIPFSGIVLLINLVSFIVISVTAAVSLLYALSLVLNIALFAICVKFYFNLSIKNERSLVRVIKNIFENPGNNSDRRAAIAYSTLFVFLLASTLVCADYIVKLKNPVRSVSEKDMNTFMSNFYSSEIESAELPESTIRFGNDEAKITVIVFTDFLCGACYNFYQTEKYIISRFGEKVKFVSYHYPLDTNCNSNIDETVYVNSCLASKTIQTAADMGILDKFIIHYFKSHREISHDYSLDKALMVFDQTGLGKEQRKAFEEALNSTEADSKISAHLKAAAEMKIDGTPTIFINGRKISGVPPKEMLEALIAKELEGK